MGTGLANERIGSNAEVSEATRLANTVEGGSSDADRLDIIVDRVL